MSDLIKPITPSITELKTGTPIIKSGDNYIVAGIGGDFIPGGASEGVDTSDATATAGDVSAGLVFYNAEGRQTGTLEDVTATLDGATVTVPAGRIKTKQALTVPASSGATVNGNTVTVGKGYLADDVYTSVASGSVAISGQIVTVSEGYVNSETKTVESGSVALDETQNKVIISEGYVQSGEIDISCGGTDTSDANVVTASDVSEGLVFYNAEGRQVGTLTTVTATQDGNTVTVPAGRIMSEQIFTIIPDGVAEGSVTLSGDTITITEGYVSAGTLKVATGSVVVDTELNKVVVTEGYVQSDELPLPGGFQLVKVTHYNPTREALTAPSQVVVSGIGTIGSDDWSTDGSAANGTYIVTDETKYKKGLARVYKQQGGNYYLAGYDPDDYEWAEYSANWFISTSPDGYGWSALLQHNGETIPSGENSWISNEFGDATVTTAVTTETIAALAETISACAVTAFDEGTDAWTEGDPVSISDYTLTPQVPGIYYAQGGKLIGQHINRDLNIPSEGLVRRFKAVGKHFADTVWGTEMMPSGDISFDELGYAGNNAAPMAKTIGSYLSAANALLSHTERTYNVFVKPTYNPGNRMVFGISEEGDDSYNAGIVKLWLKSDGTVIGGAMRQDVTSSIKYSPCRWNMLTLTTSHTLNESNPVYLSQVNLKLYINGTLAGEKNVSTGVDLGYATSSLTKIQFFASMNSTSDTFIGQIDEACIWDRILTDEEIAEMAKGVKTFDWDVEVPEYVQEQPVVYAPLTDASKYCLTGQLIHYKDVSNNTDIATTGHWRNGAFWNYKTNADGNLEYANMAIGSNYQSFYTSGSCTVCVDVYFEDIINRDTFIERGGTYIILGNENNKGYDMWGICLYNNAGSDTVYAKFKAYNGNVAVEKNTWTTIIARVTDGTVDLFSGGVSAGSGTVSNVNYPFGDYSTVKGPFGIKGAIRNIRLYNRALSNEEIEELSVGGE